VALWTLTAMAGLTASPHQIDCADEADTLVVAHDPGGHGLGAVRTSEDPLHCVLCHWIRGFSAEGIRALRLTVAPDSSFSPVLAPVQATRAAARLSLSPRAPPI
jgi:hypothetical protein